jgi:hypothetical protein
MKASWEYSSGLKHAYFGIANHDCANAKTILDSQEIRYGCGTLSEVATP